MKITIDRIENDVIAIELPDGKMIDIPCHLFPDAAEGDVYSIEKDSAAGDSRRCRVEDKMRRLFKD
ncbi:MAG: DUF3006 domain-containing protein [Clostridiales bacterium]|jgi:hypothetical protein|nr:DUF3006 domain-containing protein [Clostridiales bacterium]